MKRTFLLSTLLLIYTLVFTGKIYAQKTAPSQILKVSPVIISIQLSPGKTQQYDIDVENMLDTPLPLQASFSDIDSASEDGGYSFPDSHTSPLASWITLDKTQLILPAHKKQTVHFTVKTPNTIPLGGYSEMIFFEPVLPGKALLATQIVPRIGVLLLASIGVPDKQQAEIVDFSLGGIFHQSNTVRFFLRTKNTSLHFFTAKPILYIKPLWGEEEKTILHDKIVFPGKIRRWDEQITLPITQPNIYRVTLALSTGNGNFTYDKHYIIVFPFITTGLALLGICLILMTIWKRKQITRAFYILLKG